jgi:hypothetical protein
MTTQNEIYRLASLLATARVRSFAVHQGIGGPNETNIGVDERVEQAKKELTIFADSVEASRAKGWALAKSLQRQVDILKPVVDMAAAGNTEPDALQALAVEAFVALEKHRET